MLWRCLVLRRGLHWHGGRFDVTNSRHSVARSSAGGIRRYRLLLRTHVCYTTTALTKQARLQLSHVPRVCARQLAAAPSIQHTGQNDVEAPYETQKLRTRISGKTLHKNPSATAKAYALAKPHTGP